MTDSRQEDFKMKYSAVKRFIQNGYRWFPQIWSENGSFYTSLPCFVDYSESVTTRHFPNGFLLDSDAIQWAENN